MWTAHLRDDPHGRSPLIRLRRRFLSGDPREIPFDFAQGRLSLRLKNGSDRDDANMYEDLAGFKLHHYRRLPPRAVPALP